MLTVNESEIYQGSRLTKNAVAILRQDWKIRPDFAKFSRKIVALHCVVSGLAKQNMSPQYLCVMKPLKMANDRKNGKDLFPYVKVPLDVRGLGWR